MPTSILNRLAPYDPQGAGADTQGGNQSSTKNPQNKNILHVTTLEDTDGGGSLRAAINQSGARIIVFNVCGVIRLRKPLDIVNGNVTIDGSFLLTSQNPGVGGICLRGFPVNIKTDQVILRYLHLRLGDSTEIPNASGQLPTRLPKGDALNLGKTDGNISNVVLDHLSLSWSVDELLGIRNADDITLQYCILSESLSHSFHIENNSVIEHSKGALITLGGANNKMTLYKNLFAHNRDRNPRIGNGKYDIRNNIFYNYGKVSAGITSTDLGANVNYVNNYLKPGTNSPSGNNNFFDIRNSGVKIYITGNTIFGDAGGTTDNKSRVKKGTGPAFDNIFSDDAFGGFGQITTDTADAAFIDVLNNAGALFPRRDSVDERIVNDVRNGTGRIIDSPGYPDYCQGVPSADPDANTPDDDND